jgi:hypothetical protein
VLSDRELERWQNLLEARTAWLSVLGIPYVFLVAPDPHAVYAESLPAAATGGATRPVLQLLDRLAAAKSWATVVYPLAALREARAEAPVYPRADSRWSGFGAYVACRELMAALTATLPVRRVTRRDVRIVQRLKAGNLGRRSRLASVEMISPRARLVRDNGLRGRGRLLEYRADSYNALACIVFGDRLARRLVPLVAESFERTFWAHTSFDHALVRELRPDAVVTVAAEHTLVELPRDTAAGIRRLEAREARRAARDSRASRAQPRARAGGGRGRAPRG